MTTGDNDGGFSDADFGGSGTIVTKPKPMACSSALRDHSKGYEERIHLGYGPAVPKSTFRENQPRKGAAYIGMI